MIKGFLAFRGERRGGSICPGNEVSKPGRTVKNWFDEPAQNSLRKTQQGASQSGRSVAFFRRTKVSVGRGAEAAGGGPIRALAAAPSRRSLEEACCSLRRLIEGTVSVVLSLRLPTRGWPCRSHFQRRQAGRLACAKADEVRTYDQRQRQGARSRRATDVARVPTS